MIHIRPGGSLEDQSTANIPQKPDSGVRFEQGYDPVLIFLTGSQRGTRVKLDRQEVVLGRGRGTDMVIRDDGVSRKHFRVVCVNPDRHPLDLPEFRVEDLGSRNGTELNGERLLADAPLHERDRIQAGGVTFGFFLRDDNELNRELSLYEMATCDALSGLSNRYHFLDSLGRYLDDTRPNACDLCLVILDIDFFKRFNDEHGHDIGDLAIKHVAALIQLHTRATDLSARWGGEEFVVVFPRTDLKQGRHLAECLRAEIAGSPVPVGDPGIPITVSIGAALRLEGESFDAWFKRADLKLYQAKQEGRNRVVADDGGAEPYDDFGDTRTVDLKKR